jgi:hypothetical protein
MADDQSRTHADVATTEAKDYRDNNDTGQMKNAKCRMKNVGPALF